MFPPRPGNEHTASEGLVCKYDAWNRLVAVYKDTDGDHDGVPDAGDTLIAEYQYDGLHRRIVKLQPDGVNWKRTDYYYSITWQVLEECFDDGIAPANKDTPLTTATVQYVWDVRYIDAPVLRWRDTDDNGSLDETLYYCSDVNMDVTALLSDSGTVLERYVYDPYGRATTYNPDWTSTITWNNSKKNEVLYCGYRYDAQTRLYHVRFRYLHPTLGRWLQRDPSGYRDGLALYQYADSLPTVTADPLGLEPEHRTIIEPDAPPTPPQPWRPHPILYDWLQAYAHWANGDGSPRSLSAELMAHVKRQPGYRWLDTRIQSSVVRLANRGLRKCKATRAEKTALTETIYCGPWITNEDPALAARPSTSVLGQIMFNYAWSHKLHLTIGTFKIRADLDCVLTSGPCVRGKWKKFSCSCEVEADCRIKYKIRDRYQFYGTGNVPPIEKWRLREWKKISWRLVTEIGNSILGVPGDAASRLLSPDPSGEYIAPFYIENEWEARKAVGSRIGCQRVAKPSDKTPKKRDSPAGPPKE